MKNKDKKIKKPSFEKPRLLSHGNLSEISQTSSTGGPGDGGSAPYDRKGTMMCLTPPPEIIEHNMLIEDQNCQIRHQRIIEDIVRSGDRVLDLGTGTGIHTLFALQAGAEQVTSVDASPILEFAKLNIKNNNYESKVRFIKTRFDQLEKHLPRGEKFDVILSNIGFLSCLTELPLIYKKFLKPGGRTIPTQLELHFNPLTASPIYQSQIQFWKNQPFGLNMDPMKELATNQPYYIYLTPENLLTNESSPQLIDLIHFNQQSWEWNMEFEISKDETLHGIGGWYNFYAEEKEYLSTRPPHDMNRDIWNNFIFPVNEPIFVKKGERISARIGLNLMNPPEPIWKWEVFRGEKILSRSTNFILP